MNEDVQHLQSKRAPFGRLATIVLATLIVIVVIAASFSQTEQRPTTFAPEIAGGILGFSPLTLVLFSIFGVGLILGLAALQFNEAYKISLLLVAFSGLVFQLLPTVEGTYFYGGGDPSNFLGTMLTIQRTGMLTPLNPYPAMHILGVAISDATSLPLLSVVPLLQETFYITFLLGGFVVISSIFVERTERRIAFLMIFAMPMGFVLIPQFYGLSLVPMLVFLNRNNARSALASYTFLLLALAIIHPLVAVLFVASTWFWTALSKKRLIDQRVVLGLSAVGFMFGYDAILTASLGSILGHLSLGVSPASGVSVAVSSLGLLNSAEIALKQASFAPFLALIVIALWLRTRRHDHGTILVYFLVLSIALFFPAFLVPSLAASLGYSRSFWYIEFGAFLVSGIVASQMKVPWKGILFASMLILVFMSAIVTTYGSSYNLYPSGSVTRSNYVSDGWLFQYAPAGVAIGGPLFSPTNAWNLVQGSPTQATGNYIVYPFNLLQVSHHFSNTTAGPGGTILVVSSLAILTYVGLYKATNTFTASDFHMIANSPQFNIVYSGSDEQFYLVTGVGTS